MISFFATEPRLVRIRALLVIFSLAFMRPGPTVFSRPVRPAATRPETGPEARQVTVMVIRARKGQATVDPKLSAVESRLAQLLPNFGFTLEDGKTREIEQGESMASTLKEAKKLSVRLLDSEDADGKVRMKVLLVSGNQTLIDSTVRTPPNQIFFLDHRIDDSEHLLIAVGAR